MPRLSLLILFSLASLALADNFFYASSTQFCDKGCPEATWFRFYSCDSTCTYHIQPWIASIITMLCYVVVSAVVGCVVRCICCCR
ncbi:hypothetical protein QR680_010922 [Steinernema hermaphroditum]|uniref:Uncharacterized protein n=1 Tax=Steinernema hermaphroditum TaxID=289476 RepID=A0AA39IS06_9BILA|nr:hypothetical protein QR680_010922 [Steinernema hermaphroditum]